jgi:preprotein translocase subunit SecE
VKREKIFFSLFALLPLPFLEKSFFVTDLPRFRDVEPYSPVDRGTIPKKPNAEHPPVGAFFQELFNVGLYKRSQGRITRQVTFAAMAIIFAVGFYRMHQMLAMVNIGETSWAVTATLYKYEVAYWLPGVLLLLCLWVSYRLVNMPSFADFLIAVEAELNKVSWPTRTELIRSSIVVLVSLLVLASVIFGFDLVWRYIFIGIGIIGKG